MLFGIVHFRWLILFPIIFLVLYVETLCGNDTIAPKKIGFKKQRGIKAFIYFLLTYEESSTLPDHEQLVLTKKFTENLIAIGAKVRISLSLSFVTVSFTSLRFTAELLFHYESERGHRLC